MIEYVLHLDWVVLNKIVATLLACCRACIWSFPFIQTDTKLTIIT